MTTFDAFLYGMVQGLTEYLPVSSSAHLTILPKILNQEDPGLAFDVFLHLGTLFATLIYFRKEWIGMFNNIFRGRTEKDISWKLLVVATIPALIAGLLFHKAAETIFRANWITAASMALGGILLYWSDSFFPLKRSVSNIKMKDSIWMGLGQCLALIPGFSRSGSTIMAGRFLGLNRAAVTKMSFLMSGPVTAAAIVFEMRKWGELVHSGVGMTNLIVAGVSAFAFGILAIGGLLRIVKNFSFLGFVVYRLAFAVAIFWAFGSN